MANPMEPGFIRSVPAQNMRFQRFAPQQETALNQLLQMGIQGMQHPTSGFEPIASQAKREFSEQIVPGIAERFTGGFGVPGASSAQRSSGFAQMLGSAGSGLESQLAAMQAQYGQQAQRNLLGLLSLGLTPQYENMFMPRQPSFMENLGLSIPRMLPLLGAFL